MRVHFFGFSAHPQDMYYLCTNLVVHILQMLWKFRIFPEHFTQIPGLFFCTSPGHVLHLHMLSHFFRCSSHPWDMYYICTMGVIFHFGHLATNLFVHILQMPWKFHIFPGYLYRHQGGFFQIFHTLPGHVLLPSILYFGYLATNLVVHILQMLWKFRIFPGHP